MYTPYIIVLNGSTKKRFQASFHFFLASGNFHDSITPSQTENAYFM